MKYTPKYKIISTSHIDFCVSIIEANKLERIIDTLYSRRKSTYRREKKAILVVGNHPV